MDRQTGTPQLHIEDARRREQPSGDTLDGYRYHGSPSDAVTRTSYEQVDRVQFRRHAEQQLNTIVSTLESGRDQMKQVHAMARAGYGPGTRQYDQAFTQAKQAYFQAIQTAGDMLWTKDAQGRIVPNQFYKATEQERQRLQQEMAANRGRNPQEYARLAREDAMLGDVLQASGYAHANFGLALIRSSVYLPKATRDQQMEQGNQMLRLAGSYDPQMMGDPPRRPADPNFKRHLDAIMRAVTATPYIDSPRTQIPPTTYTPPRDGAVTAPPLRQGEGPRPGADVAVTNPPQTGDAAELQRLRAQLATQERDHNYALEAARGNPRSPLNRYANEVARIKAEQKSLTDQIGQLGRNGSTEQQQALGWMWNNIQTVAQLQQFYSSSDPNIQPIAQQVRSHPNFAQINSAFGQFLNKKVQLGALEDGLKRDPQTKMFWDRLQAMTLTRQRIATIERAQAQPPAVQPPPDVRPVNPNPGGTTERPVSTNPDTGKPATDQQVEIPADLRAKVAGLPQIEKIVKDAPAAFSEAQRNAGDQRKELPANVRTFFAQANGLLRANPPEKIAEMVEAQRSIHRLRLDKMVPNAEQQPIQERLKVLQANLDKSMAALSPESKTALVGAEAEIDRGKTQLKGKYLQAIPQYKAELQAINNISLPNSAQRAQLINELNGRFLPQVETNAQYKAEVKTLESQTMARLQSSSNTNLDEYLQARKALDDYIASDRKVFLMNAFAKANKDLDAVSHATAIVQSYEARTLLFSNNARDHARAAELMSAAQQDPAAAQYLAKPKNELLATTNTQAAADLVNKANDPLTVFGAQVPGTGGIARGLAQATDGGVFGGRLQNQSAATLQLADSFALDPNGTKARIAALTAQGNAHGVGLLRDGGSLAAYGGTYWGLGLLKHAGKALPGPAKVVAAAVAAAATSDYLEDEKLDGPINDPGAWARGAGVGLGGHGAYNALLGKWSQRALGQAVEARTAALGGEAALGAKPWSAEALKETGKALVTPGNIVGRNPLVTEATIASADAAQLLAIKRNLGAMQYHRAIQTAFTVGAGHQTLKIVDGDTKVDGVADATGKVLKEGLYSAGTSAILAPALAAPVRFGVSKIPGGSAWVAGNEVTAAYSFARTYGSDIYRSGMDYSRSRDLQAAADGARDAESLVKAYQRVYPTMSDSEARARAAMYLQVIRGQEQVQSAGAGK